MSYVIQGSSNKLAALCENCRAVLRESSRITVFTHSVDGDKRRVIAPADILAIQADNKGLFLHLKSGETVFEYMVLKDIEASYPGLFFRAARNWLVANDAVSTTYYKRPTHYLQLAGSDVTIPVARRMWRSVANRFGIKLKSGLSHAELDVARSKRDMSKAVT